MLKDLELEAKIKPYGIGKLKPKKMLVDDLSTLYRLLRKQAREITEA